MVLFGAGQAEGVGLPSHRRLRGGEKAVDLLHLLPGGVLYGVVGHRVLPAAGLEAAQQLHQRRPILPRDGGKDILIAQRPQL